MERGGLLLVLIGLTVVVAAAGCTDQDSSQADGGTATLTPPATPALAGPPLPGPSLPELTEEERTEGLEIALSDERVASLLEGHAHTVEAIGVWTTPKSHQKVGAGIVVSFAPPVSVEGDFPYVDYGGDEHGAAWDEYREGVTHVASKSVSELHIMVDLSRRRVVAINPY